MQATRFARVCLEDSIKYSYTFFDFTLIDINVKHLVKN